MKLGDHRLAEELDSGLETFHRNNRPLLGILDACNRASFVEQLLESIHRVKFVHLIKTRDLDPNRANPHSDLFDPLKAAILQQRNGNFEEAFWLVFLFVHFGQNRRGGWRFAREVYGKLGQRPFWDWTRVSSRPKMFRKWLRSHDVKIRRDGVPGGFGNHRKYQSLDADSANGTGAAVETYVEWIKPPRTHLELVGEAMGKAKGDRYSAFDILFHSMSRVASFGRTARFDYLTMLGKMNLAEIEPGSTYMHSSTGPLSGARLLFGGEMDADLTAADLDSWLSELDNEIQVGMQVLEDALCNWQKSPAMFVPFRG